MKDAQQGKPEAIELADVFCRQATRRAKAYFKAIWSNDDRANYRLARGVLEGRYRWLEQGIAEFRDVAGKSREQKDEDLVDETA